MTPEIPRVANAMIHITALPNFAAHLQLFRRAMRKSAFDKLGRALQSNVLDCRQNMYVIRYDYEFVQQKLSLVPIVQQSFDQQHRYTFGLKQRLTVKRAGSNEVRVCGK